MEEKSNKKNNVIFIVIGVSLVIIFAVCGWKLGTWYADYQDKNNNQVEEKNENNNEEKVELKEEEIEELESYLLPANYWRNSDKVGMFAKEKVTIDNLDNYGKLVAIFLKLKYDGYTEKVEFYDIDWKLRTDITDYDYDGYMYYSDINKELIHEYAIKMFGKDDLVDEEFSLFSITCEYSEDYKCYMFPGGGTGYPHYYMELDRYEVTNDEVVLYHKYVYFLMNQEYWKYGIYTSHDSDNELALYEDDKDDKYYLEEYGTMYKTIFKKDDNGNYYWLSSEPVK